MFTFCFHIYKSLCQKRSLNLHALICALHLSQFVSFSSVQLISKTHICRCVITGNGSTSYAYLGRPWGPFGRVVFAYTWMDACVRPEGWHNWDKPENERNACFYEYRYWLFFCGAYFVHCRLFLSLLAVDYLD